MVKRWQRCTTSTTVYRFWCNYDEINQLILLHLLKTPIVNSIGVFYATLIIGIIMGSVYLADLIGIKKYLSFSQKYM